MQLPTEIWRQLAAECKNDPGWHGRRLHVNAITPIYAALKFPNRTKGLLLEVKSRSIHPSSSFPSSSSFTVNLETLALGPNGSVRICLELADPKYEDLFALLAEDIAETVASAVSETTGLSMLIGRLNAWQKFFKRQGDGILTEQEQLGLFAEALVLRELLAAGLNASAAIDAWRGPLGGAQDFCLAGCSVEVKATSSWSSTCFEVSNLLQLDERPLPCLLVRHFTLIRMAGQGETLPYLLDEIAANLEASDLAAGRSFSENLLKVGYSKAHRSHYETDGFSVQTDRHFHVQDSFPRLLADEVRLGVSSCKYSVQLSACLPFLIEPEMAQRIIHGIQDDR